MSRKTFFLEPLPAATRAAPMRTILQVCVLLLLLGAGNRVWAGVRCNHAYDAAGHRNRKAAISGSERDAAAHGCSLANQTPAGEHADSPGVPPKCAAYACDARGLHAMKRGIGAPRDGPGMPSAAALALAYEWVAQNRLCMVWLQVGPNVYAYVKQNPWSKYDPEGLANLNLTGSQDEAHSAFSNDGTNGIGVFTIGAHCQYTGYAHVSDGRETGGTGGGPYVTPKEVLAFMKKAGWKEGTPILVLGCEAGGNGTAKGTIWTNCFASELAKITGVPVGGPNKDLFMNYPSGKPDTWKSRYDKIKKTYVADKLPDTNGPDKDNAKNGHVVWYDPKGNPIDEPGYPVKGWDHEFKLDNRIHMDMPQYVRDHMNKQNKVESSSRKPTKYKTPQTRKTE